jgi:hypothetical protein
VEFWDRKTTFLPISWDFLALFCLNFARLTAIGVKCDFWEIFLFLPKFSQIWAINMEFLDRKTTVLSISWDLLAIFCVNFAGMTYI